MKKVELTKTLFAIAIIALSVTAVSCGGKKKAALGTKVEVPCGDDKYHSDKNYFRGTGMGESTNLSTAKRKASLDANAMLAASVNRTIKTVSDRYTQDITVGDASEFAEKFEDMTRSVVDLSLIHISEPTRPY